MELSEAEKEEATRKMVRLSLNAVDFEATSISEFRERIERRLQFSAPNFQVIVTDEVWMLQLARVAVGHDRAFISPAVHGPIALEDELDALDEWIGFVTENDDSADA